MKDHGAMALADYLIDKLDAGRRFTSSRTSWDGSDTVTIRVKDENGDLWGLEIRPWDDDA